MFDELDGGFSELLSNLFGREPPPATLLNLLAFTFCICMRFCCLLVRPCVFVFVELPLIGK